MFRTKRFPIHVSKLKFEPFSKWTFQICFYLRLWHIRRSKIQYLSNKSHSQCQVFFKILWQSWPNHRKRNLLHRLTHFWAWFDHLWVGFGRFLGLNGQKRPFLTTFRPLKSYIEFQWECDLPELIIEMNLVDTKSTLFCSGTHSVYLVSAESGQVVTQVQIEGNRMVKCTLLPIIEP